MPGSLLSRHDSTRSDDGKKVSFNRAVRVKNLPQKEKKDRHFWHRDRGEEYHESVLSGSSDDDRNLSPILESPKPRGNMVHRYNEEPRAHSTPKSYSNGTAMDREEDVYYATDFPVHERSPQGPFKTKIIISNDTRQETSNQPPRAYYYNEDPPNFEQSLGEFHSVLDHINGANRKHYEEEIRSYSPSFERKKEDYNTKCKYKYVAESNPSSAKDSGNWSSTKSYSYGTQENSFPVKKTSYSYNRPPEPAKYQDYSHDKRKDDFKYTERVVSSKKEPEEYHYPKNGYKYEKKEEPSTSSLRYTKQSYAPYKEQDQEESPSYYRRSPPHTQVTVVKETEGRVRNGQGPRVVSKWDSGDQLLADNRETSTSTERSDRGHYIRTKGEQSRVWGRRKEVVYEEQPWNRRAVSHDNLLLDEDNSMRKSKKNGISASVLSVHSKVDNKAVQCNGSVRFNASPVKENGGRLIKSRNGVVSAFSDVPVIETATVANHTRSRSQDSYLSDEKNSKPEVIYSRVDLNKKKRDRLNNSVDGYSFKTSSRSYKFGSTPALNDADLSSNASSNRERRVKTTKKGFGMRLFGSRRSESPRASPRYYREDPDSSDTSHIPESVVKGYDHKKKVLNYENVPHQKPRESSSREGSIWFAGSEDDYRRGMAQDDVACIGAASVVGTDPVFATMSRLEKAKKEDTPLTSYTLDRRHMKERKSRPPTLMVNGKIRDSSDDERRGAASDTSSVRGGLSAAYQARCRAASRTRSTPPGSSDGEASHRRRTLVMYIPGVSHDTRAADEDDRSSGITVARSQSILSSRPPRKAASSRARPSPQLRRRHSIPKSTNFSWFKWRVKAKPSREP